MLEMRVRNKIPAEELEGKKGKIITDDAANVILRGPSKVLAPDGKPLAIYLPGAVREEGDAAYDILHTIKLATDNRGLASGMPRVQVGSTRSRHLPVMSGVLGAMDPVGPMQYCRLTAFTAKEVEKWSGLFPLFQAIALHFEQNVPDRFANQVAQARQTPDEWVIPETPFTTITVNNTYPTGVHTDKGDLDEGFSCLACVRRGEYEGGMLVFPEYRIGCDMQNGDLLLMDAHQWHGNSQIVPHSDDAERISVVCYYRTQMKTCGTQSQEDEKRYKAREGRWSEKDDSDADAAAIQAVTTNA